MRPLTVKIQRTPSGRYIAKVDGKMKVCRSVMEAAEWAEKMMAEDGGKEAPK